MTISEITKGLDDCGYIASREIAIAVSGAINQNIPVLIEGAPGVGKTSLAQAVAKMTGLPLYRVQFYEGLTYDKILYDYDYQKQLLTIETMRSALEQQMKKKSLDEARDIAAGINFYGEEFLIKRPIAKAFDGTERCVLLLDELDKSSEEIEYTLLECLDEYAISVPQYGRIVCPEDKKPIIFLTSNNYRELSDALRRRCGYLYLEPKTVDETKKIIMKKAEVDEAVANGIARCMDNISRLPLKQVPSIAEAITWARYLKDSGETVTTSTLDSALFMLVKTKRDRDVVKANFSQILR